MPHDHTTDEPIEEWRPVAGYEETYEVSSLGNVRSIDRVVTHLNRWGTTTDTRKQGKALRPLLSPTCRYHIVNLHKPGVPRRGASSVQLIHKLVAHAFLGERPEGHQIHHIDGDRFNNRANNLQYKAAHAHASEHHMGNIPGNAKLTLDQAEEIRRLCAAGTATHREIARQFGVSFATVTFIKQRKRWDR